MNRQPWDTDAHRERYAKVLRREMPLEDAIGETLNEMTDDLVADIDRLLREAQDSDE